MKFSKKQTWIIIIGLGLLLSNSFVLYAIFLEAIVSNNFIAVFEINKYEEAPFEFIFMPINILLGLYAIYLVITDLKDKKDENTKG